MEEKKGIIAEFKEFISRGNVIDLAVGVIIGSSFTAIVNSLVNDVVMPAIGMIIGQVSFDKFKYVISAASGDTPESAIYYGLFIQNIVNFLLIALVVFLMVKGINKMHKKEEVPVEEAPAEPTDLEKNNELLKANIAVLESIQKELQKQNQK